MSLKSGNEPVPVQIARTTIEVYIREGRIVTTDEVPPFGENPAGCFVSIHAHGSLRGCIGTILPTKETVAAEIIRNAVSASTEDPRFDAVRSEELEELDISVDILSGRTGQIHGRARSGKVRCNCYQRYTPRPPASGS